MQTCSVEDLKEVLNAQNKNVYFIDVRTTGEFKRSHIEGFINIPLGSDIKEFEKFKNDTLYLLCLSGDRSGMACQILEKEGFKGAINVERGLLLWRMKRYSEVSG